MADLHEWVSARDAQLTSYFTEGPNVSDRRKECKDSIISELEKVIDTVIEQDADLQKLCFSASDRSRETRKPRNPAAQNSQIDVMVASQHKAQGNHDRHEHSSQESSQEAGQDHVDPFDKKIIYSHFKTKVISVLISGYEYEDLCQQLLFNASFSLTKKRLEDSGKKRIIEDIKDRLEKNSVEKVTNGVKETLGPQDRKRWSSNLIDHMHNEPDKKKTEEEIETGYEIELADLVQNVDRLSDNSDALDHLKEHVFFDPLEKKCMQIQELKEVFEARRKQSAKELDTILKFYDEKDREAILEKAHLGKIPITHYIKENSCKFLLNIDLGIEETYQARYFKNDGKECRFWTRVSSSQDVLTLLSRGKLPLDSDRYKKTQGKDITDVMSTQLNELAGNKLSHIGDIITAEGLHKELRIDPTKDSDHVIKLKSFWPLYRASDFYMFLDIFKERTKHPNEDFFISPSLTIALNPVDQISEIRDRDGAKTGFTFSTDAETLERVKKVFDNVNKGYRRDEDKNDLSKKYDPKTLKPIDPTGNTQNRGKDGLKTGCTNSTDTGTLKSIRVQSKKCKTCKKEFEPKSHWYQECRVCHRNSKSRNASSKRSNYHGNGSLY